MADDEVCANRLNAGGANKKRGENLAPTSMWERDSCVNPIVGPLSSIEMRDVAEQPRGVTRRQVTTQTPGYTTKDDFGTDGEAFFFLSSFFFYTPKSNMMAGKTIALVVVNTSFLR